MYVCMYVCMYSLSLSLSLPHRSIHDALHIILIPFKIHRQPFKSADSKQPRSRVKNRDAAERWKGGRRRLGDGLHSDQKALQNNNKQQQTTSNKKESAPHSICAAQRPPASQ